MKTAKQVALKDIKGDLKEQGMSKFEEIVYLDLLKNNNIKLPK